MKRIIPFYTMDVLLRYAEYLCSLAGARVMAVLPNSIAVHYNDQVILLIARDYQGD